MKAVLYTAFGPPDVLQLHEVQKPSPQTNEVLVKVHAASINALEWRRFTMPAALVRMFSGGLFEPKNKTIGADFAGRVEAVGASVTRFKPGDEVFGIKRGSFADYVCALETLVTPKPANVSFEAASTVPVAALTALQAIRDQGNTQPGQHVLIYGAGGGVGTFAVQIAKYFGAEVTAICGPQSQDTARAIGSDHVIDYTKEDFTKSAARYDRIIAVNGHQSILDYRRALKPNGIYAVAGGSMSQMFQCLVFGALLSWGGNRKMKGVMARPNPKDLDFLGELLASGRIIPVIDRCYPFRETAEAMRYVLKGHVRGKVVLTNDN